MKDRFNNVVGIVKGVAQDAARGSRRAVETTLSGLRAHAPKAVRRLPSKLDSARTKERPLSSPATRLPVPAPHTKPPTEPAQDAVAGTATSGTHPAPAKKAAPAKRAATAKKSTPAKKATPATRATPAKKAAPAQGAEPPRAAAADTETESRSTPRGAPEGQS